MAAQTLRLPSEGSNYGVLCHRQFADRIQEALIPPDEGSWAKLGRVDANDKDDTSALARVQQQPHTSGKQNKKCVVIPTPEMKGPRKERTGYTLLVFEGAVKSPVSLPPMTRKQISWAGKVTHASQFTQDLNVPVEYDNSNGSNKENNQLQSAVLKSLPHEIWKDLKNSTTFNPKFDHLRIDVQPKSFNSQVCDAFIAEANSTYTNEMDQDGEVKLACSASKVSHIVNIIILQQSSLSPRTTDVYWGISTTKEHFEELNQRLNNNATNEVILESTCPKNGVDSQTINGAEGSLVQWDAPVSRAYYKLAQVFEDEQLLKMIASLHSNSNNDCNGGNKSITKSILSHGAGLDIGASPGGWTQVLHNTLGLSTCIAIDPGILANRVMSLSGVHHLRSELSTEETFRGIAQHAPYSAIVCDASMSHVAELLVKIIDTFKKASSLLQGDNEARSQRSIFAWPMCLVLTLKLPYKTNSSIERILEQCKACIPDYLRQIASIDSGDEVIDVQYKICHLFANSVAERTLIAVFHKR